ncbi:MULTISPECIES: ATP synthase F0 subunit B [Desulfovibrio]|jgi:F0F1-type ATP synthase, subunit b|uniref:ATP synthase subunit b n=2 Tax=root TaxID=1 RepID=A0A212JW61_9BACT|nr:MULTISPECIES: ATP synthase F0 subunit B [Desulfovibrio]MBD8896347.1 ATP synthase F0 subunit B [Desulfovibrio desulfuricans]MBT9748706.1 ATPase [Desulfovibrio desulfuricans]MCB6542738.1 ATP synthase F0 subunit B [Desulfovibrio desulfuricans]MCB6553700.1 ATP synthase F0 subunit B [Desulfovibrio desulfuricans]MCB6565784.1 ATP synthase F0 subunit B [Desulfovibrio desulfuricans]
MLDLNVTLLFQLANFFIAIYVLNILLIRPIREIIKKRNGVMDDMAEEAGSFEYQAGERLTNYEAELARARQDAGSNREAGRAAGVAEQQKLVGEAQQSARDILAETRASLQAQAAETLAALRKQVGEFSTRLADRLIKG